MKIFGIGAILLGTVKYEVFKNGMKIHIAPSNKDFSIDCTINSIETLPMRIWSSTWEVCRSDSKFLI